MGDIPYLQFLNSFGKTVAQAELFIAGFILTLLR